MQHCGQTQVIPMPRYSKKSFWKAILLLSFILIIWRFFFASPTRTLSFEEQPKSIILSDNGLSAGINTRAQTVDKLLEEQKIPLSEHDEIIPDKSSPILPNMIIEIRRAMKISIAVDDKKIENYTLAKTVPLILAENSVILGRLDKTDPPLSGPVTDGTRIIVTRINVEEKVIPQDIPFKTITKTDAKLGWREKRVETPGVNGILEVKYRITYKNGQEVSRIALEKNIAQEPVTEVVTQGTYVKTGNVQKGQGTWYAYQGGMFAASTVIPRGGYARVTNTANGKSIIVQINDYGPQGKGRVIDLDKVAFQKIASLGAGVIGVKVEEVLN